VGRIVIRKGMRRSEGTLGASVKNQQPIPIPIGIPGGTINTQIISEKYPKLTLNNNIK
jgi:hypothetical protein